ncbi:uncharacterized protein si:ch211-170d8.2 [Thalassophryne amazonica]|uniref:uncharacterized protein si:ch211-170d8.2 n=1 Tax=Thalassophryne amazonica TaxID=390379 RepID=UPI0014721E71|nr:uncharacterized protein si:ch211-170d8.2 [Thalassophryne amazonica]
MGTPGGGAASREVYRRSGRVGPDPDRTMTCWILLWLLSTTIRDTVVFGRAVDGHGFLSQAGDESTTHARERCAELAAPWLENTEAVPDHATPIRLRVRSAPPAGSRVPLFPGKSLFGFVRRVYRCCRERAPCARVKGLQGRKRGTDLEFVVSRDILLLTVTRAELHLQIFNPERLDVRPVLPSLTKRSLPTRFNVWPQGDVMELSVDLLFLFQALQEAAGGARVGPALVNMWRMPPQVAQDTAGYRWGEGLPAVDLGVALGCSRAGSKVSCGPGGVRLAHMPFIVLSYR